VRSYAFTFCVSLFVAVLFTPLVRWLAIRVGAVSRPRARDIHERAVPRLGGVAIAVAFFSPLLALSALDTGVAQTLREQPRLALGLAVGGVVLGALGVADDTIGVRARNKFAAQLLVAVFAYAMGFRIEAVSVPLLGVWEMGVFALPITALWIVGVVNAVNLIDGLDGLAAGVIFFAALTNFVVAVIGQQVFVAVVMAAIMGAMVGFLFYNFNPAHIFMGDSGSYFLGYLLATASLTGAMQKTSTAVSLLVPMVALGVPIFDTLFSMLRRTLERRSMFSPDRGHVHHRLIDMGITHRRAVMLLYGVSILLMVSAIAIALGRSWESGVALLVASVVLTGLIRFVGYFEYVRMRRRAVTRSYDARTRRLGQWVPGLSLELAAAQTEEQIWAKLCAFAVQAECVVVSFLVSSAAIERRWPANMTLREPEGLVRARYGLAGDGHLEFGFSGDAELASESDVLLQLVADAVELRLRHRELREASAPRPVGASVPEATLAAASAEPLPDARELGGADGLLSSGGQRWLASR
jgi:UDP-GlcNAc:undecaprenyl-phosphate/decaprenyl-phosphate GlcNAc-1-phosphate transferase